MLMAFLLIWGTQDVDRYKPVLNQYLTLEGAIAVDGDSAAS
jgi:hypothetical protein